MRTAKGCPECGVPCSSEAKQCRNCYEKKRTTVAAGNKRYCESCNGNLDRRAKGNRCDMCRISKNFARVEKVVEEEARIPPPVGERRHIYGSAVILSDTHIPWHHPPTIIDSCQAAMLLKIPTLIIAGDLLHADTISKYLGVGKTIPVTKELESAGRVLSALEDVFENIYVIPGNHDQRLEKLIAGLRASPDGRRALDLLAKLLDSPDPDDAEDISLRYIKTFLSSPKVEWLSLPDIILNDVWLIQHPGSVSRIGPQNERAMVRKNRKCVIQGHSHLWAVGFDESATDVAFNIGYAADDTKWRYVREKPSTFPKSVHGYGIVYQRPDSPQGRLIPVAVHDRMFRIQDLFELAGIARAEG